MSDVTAVSMSVAVESPDSLYVATKVEAPHLIAEGTPRVENLNVGKQSEIASPGSMGTFKVNPNKTEDGTSVTGLAIISMLSSTFGTTEDTADDVTIGV